MERGLTRKRVVQYPLSFHFDTRLDTKWQLGVWRALFLTELVFQRGENIWLKSLIIPLTATEAYPYGSSRRSLSLES